MTTSTITPSRSTLHCCNECGWVGNDPHSEGHHPISVLTSCPDCGSINTAEAKVPDWFGQCSEEELIGAGIWLQKDSASLYRHARIYTSHHNQTGDWMAGLIQKSARASYEVSRLCLGAAASMNKRRNAMTTYTVDVTKYASTEVSDAEVREYHDISEETWNTMPEDRRRLLALEWAHNEEGKSIELDFARKIAVQEARTH